MFLTLSIYFHLKKLVFYLGNFGGRIRYHKYNIWVVRL